MDAVGLEFVDEDGGADKSFCFGWPKLKAGADVEDWDVLESGCF